MFSPDDLRLVSRFEALLRKKSGTSPAVVRAFREIIYRHYRGHAREFPWRRTREPYRILVSEVMLQQTQTERVAQKYGEFIGAFPDFSSLARAPVREVLAAWQGLGYNRRAIALRDAASVVAEKFGGRLTPDIEALMSLPGVGRATASSVCAFAFGKNVVFVETNIRRVFLHFFFRGREGVRDSEILPLVEKALDTADPRSWYYALMDYGVFLKKTFPNPNRRSAHYVRQSPFMGSNRQLRGKILRALLSRGSMTEGKLAQTLGISLERLNSAAAGLEREGFLKKRGRKLDIRP